MRGIVKNGTVDGLTQELEKFEGLPVSIKIKKADKISDEQRAYWFGVIVKSFKDYLLETGDIQSDDMASDKLKEALSFILKKRLGFTDVVAGEPVPRSLSDSAEEEKQEVALLIDAAHAYLAENGIPIKDGRY